MSTDLPMKLCSHCGRKYPDETLNFCLDDGRELIYGPTEENETLIKEPVSRSDEETALLSTASSDRKTDSESDSSKSHVLYRRPLFVAAIAIALLLTIGLAARYRFFRAATNAVAEHIRRRSWQV